jgi:ABC-type sugar transport system ATPase subunit
MSVGGLFADGVSKWYGATRALSNVNLAIRPGRVVALVGHNGAGKSTLLRSLAGVEAPDEGKIRVGGTAMNWLSPADANASGIACVYQELSLINELTVAQNLFLGAEKLAGPLLDRRAMGAEADALCAEYGILARAGDPVSRLPVAQRQMLEVARAIHRDARYILLDEPTTALEQHQIDELLALVRKLASREIGVLLIDHKLDEVYAVADEIVCLANGQVVLSGEARDIPRRHVIEAIVRGRSDALHAACNSTSSMKAEPQHSAARGAAPAVFQARGLTGNGLAGVDLDAFPSEILGIYGLVGSGRSRFLRTAYGAEQAPEGAMTLKGKPYRPASPADAIDQGVAFLSEERKSDGIIPQMTSINNMLIPVLGRRQWLGVLNWSALREMANDVLSRIPVRGNVSQPITSLSGGNQQKVLFGRAMLQTPTLLLLDEPTKGVDIGAKAEIYEIIRQFAKEGGTVIAVSSEEEELLEIADRILVFRNGACDGQSVAPTAQSIAELRLAAWNHRA